MKAYIFRAAFFVFAGLFYYVFLGSFFGFEIAKYPSHISFLVPVVMLLIAVFSTPFIVGWGVLLFFKYPHNTWKDLWHYCLLYPGISVCILSLLGFVWVSILG